MEDSSYNNYWVLFPIWTVTALALLSVDRSSALLCLISSGALLCKELQIAVIRVYGNSIPAQFNLGEKALLPSRYVHMTWLRYLSVVGNHYPSGRKQGQKIDVPAQVIVSDSTSSIPFKSVSNLRVVPLHHGRSLQGTSKAHCSCLNW